MVRLLATLLKLRWSPLGGALALLAVLGVLARQRYGARLGSGARRAADLLLAAALAFAASLVMLDAYFDIFYPRAWDFPSFYVVAHAAAHHQAFYDAQVLTNLQHLLTRTQHVPDEWLHEVGYWYLPPSVFLILPLGWLSFQHASLLQFVIQGLYLLGSAALLTRWLPFGRDMRGFASVLLLLLLFQPVQATVNFAQIVFGCLVFLLLGESLAKRAPLAAGASLAVAFYYKHLVLIPVLFLLLGREKRGRKVALAALAGIALALLASMAVFGPHILSAWAASGPRTRSPLLAIDPVVQSLMALLYRALGVTPQGTLAHIVMFPPFLALGAVLGLATLLAQWRPVADERGARLRWALLVSLALLCYPNTLVSTLALLAPAVLIVYAESLEAGWPFALSAGFVVLVYAVTGFALEWGGWTSLLCWALAAWLTFQPAPARRPAGLPVRAPTH